MRRRARAREPARAAVDLPPFRLGDGRFRGASGRHARHAADRRADRRGRPATAGARAGEAMAIATGGVVPDGADTVVPIEDVVESGDTVEVAEVEGGREHPSARRRHRAGARSWSRPARGSARRSSARSPRRASRTCSLRAAAAGRGARDRHGAPPPGRAARAGRDLRGERLLLAAQLESRAPRSSGCARRRRRGGAPRCDRAGARGGRARHVRRRLGRAARPRAAGRGRARRRGGLLARGGAARKAGRVRRARRQARLRPARQPGLVARRLRAVRAAGAAGAAGRRRPAARVSSAGACSARRAESRARDELVRARLAPRATGPSSSR